MSTTLLLTCFTDYTPNESNSPQAQRETNQNIGWVLISLSSLFIVVYMTLIVRGIYIGVKKALTPYIEKWCNRGKTLKYAVA